MRAIIYYLETSGKIISSKIFIALSVFGHQGVILFCQYHQLNLNNEQIFIRDGENDFMARAWIKLEIYSFYLYIFSGVVYLWYVSMRGALGYTKRENVEKRYYQDAIEYYQRDIDWFAFSFIQFNLCLFGFYEIK